MRQTLVALGASLLLTRYGGTQSEDKTPLERARRLLADAGFPEGRGFPTVEILYNTQEAHKKIASTIAQSWKDGLGIEAKPVNVEWKFYLDRLSNTDYDVARRGWIGDYPDPMTFLDLLRSDSGNNNTGWKNEAYDALLRKAENETNPGRRMSLLQDAEHILLEEAPVVPIYTYSVIELYGEDEVRGYFTRPFGVQPLKDVVKGDGKGKLVLHLAGGPQTMDPARARAQPEWRILSAVFEGLLALHPQTRRPVPGVAERTEVSPDGKTYTFHFRPCRWSDGKPVRAQDFEYAWKRTLDPTNDSDFGYLLHSIRGAAEYAAGKGPSAGVGVTAKDERTLVVELTHPAPYFLEQTANPAFFPVRQDVVEKHGHRWTKAETFVGNGPYAIESWSPEGPITLRRNPNYWDADRVKQEQITAQVVENLQAAFRLYGQRKLDVLDGVPLESIPDVSQRNDFHSSALPATYFYSFNVTRKPFDDKRVRQALAMTIDRTSICDKVLRGGQKPSLSFVPPVFDDRGYPGRPRKLYK